ncbi:putative pathosis related protein [Diaporthe ampelina]|uniref:Putative pathosis related protein n=1 Tax=Diaporthe ampelina TaxID=1214573 RepID=A0A0G2FUN8_9PEZI|nr:putative pathosis related protein [Diaporthe ampelina]
MQFLTTALSLISLSSAALGCTRYTVKFRSAAPTCVDDQAAFNTHCTEIKDTIADFSDDNEDLYGSDFTSQFTGCDSCSVADPRCHCSVTAWRFHEWQSTENEYDTGVWEITQDWTPIDSKTVDC